MFTLQSFKKNLFDFASEITESQIAAVLWPSYYPDMNSIQHVWDSMKEKRELAASKCVFNSKKHFNTYEHPTPQMPLKHSSLDATVIQGVPVVKRREGHTCH